MAANDRLVMMASPDKESDQRFVAVACHHALELLLDDEPHIRELAMAVWGCLLRSPLHSVADALLQV